jgi:hypothetical protein
MVPPHGASKVRGISPRRSTAILFSPRGWPLGVTRRPAGRRQNGAPGFALGQTYPGGAEAAAKCGEVGAVTGFDRAHSLHR